MQLFKGIEGKGTYSTYARAVEKAEQVSLKTKHTFRYIIAASESGRFFPVMILSRDEEEYAGMLAAYGICVA